MKTYSFDHYYTYSELTETVQELAATYPELLSLSSICTTVEGRELWALTITNSKTGDALSKPAYYVDGNTHAGEVTGSMAALHFAITVLQGYGNDPQITELLDNNTVYSIPRISPDGAEAYLTSDNKLRSVNRPYPHKDLAPGLHPADMDGDGVIRMMRVPSPTGAWKPLDKDPRIMTKRQPGDFGGTYYNVYPEGHIVDYDGMNIEMAPNKWGLDFNRNYPLGWFPEHRQPGAGDYPLSNPENKAIVEFVLAHPNICSGVTFHTSGGCYIFPPGTMPSDRADARDMKMFKEIGKMATEETGYDCFNIFDCFLTDTVNYSSGAFDDWMYSAQGIPTYTAELWDLCLRAGVKDFFPCTEPRTDDTLVEDMYLCYQWLDANAPTIPSGPSIMEWTTIDHPQLGAVEIGGADFKYTWQNCPPSYLEAEMEKNTAFCLRMAQTAPKLVIDSFTSEGISPDVYKLTAKVSNAGYLPTFVCNEAKAIGVDKELEATLNLDGCVVIGDTCSSMGHLEGFSGINTSYSYDNIRTSSHGAFTKELVWVVNAKSGSEVSIEVGNAKSGTVSASITL